MAILLYVLFVYFFCFAGLYLHTVTETKLVVDTSRGETLRINVRFYLFHVECLNTICKFVAFALSVIFLAQNLLGTLPMLSISMPVQVVTSRTKQKTRHLIFCFVSGRLTPFSGLFWLYRCLPLVPAIIRIKWYKVRTLRVFDIQCFKLC